MSETAAPPIRRLHERDFAFLNEEYFYPRSSITLPAGAAFEDCLRPEFWVNVARQFRANPVTQAPERTGGLIAVRTEDHAFYAELYVRAVTEKGLIVAPVHEPTYFGPKTVDTDGYMTRWSIGKRAYEIVRMVDKEMVAEVKTRDLAAEWIAKAAEAARLG